MPTTLHLFPLGSLPHNTRGFSPGRMSHYKALLPNYSHVRNPFAVPCMQPCGQSCMQALWKAGMRQPLRQKDRYVHCPYSRVRHAPRKIIGSGNRLRRCLSERPCNSAPLRAAPPPRQPLLSPQYQRSCLYTVRGSLCRRERPSLL